MIVSEIAGTTRDAVDVQISSPDGPFTLVDTAGVRRPGRLGRATVERHSVLRTKSAVERCDVAVVVIDGVEGVTAQDTHIAGLVVEAAKGMVLAVNKTDLWDEPGEQLQSAGRQLRGRFQFAPWALVAFISAKTGAGLEELLRLCRTAREARRRRVSTPELNAVVRRAFASHPPAAVRGKRLKFLFATQAAVDPPTFVLFVNDPSLVHFSFLRYIERVIRQAYDFEGTAIRLVFRARAEDHGPA
jgi:GTP-binding protein